MNWYYAHEAQQVGPVSEEEFQRLRSAGTINPGTLVWREGMANWQPCGEVFSPPAAVAPAPPPPAVATVAAPDPGSALKLATSAVVCSGCGGTFPMEEVVRLGDGFVCATCKPAMLQRMREGVGNNEAEEVRKEHIKHEASVKSVGFLYLLGGTLVLVFGGIGLVGVGASAPAADAMMGVGFGAVIVLMGVLYLATGLGLRRLKPWSRIVAGIFAGIGLLGFPFGTIINAYILYLLLSGKGRMVFSSEYQTIIEQTPHIKYRTSIIVWIFLGILLLLLAFVLFSAVSVSPGR
jgi:hypothetical protein